MPIRARHRRRLRAPAIAVLGAVATGVLLAACSAANPPPAAPPGTTGRLPRARRRPRPAPVGRAWRLRGGLPYGQGSHGLRQAQLQGDRLGRSPDGALGDAAGDRQGRPSGGRRHHRRGHQGSAAGYLGAIGGRLHAVRSQAAAGLASSLAGPSLVRGTSATTDNHGSSPTLSEQLMDRMGRPTDGRSVPYNDEVTGSSPVTPTNRAEPGGDGAGVPLTSVADTDPGNRCGTLRRILGGWRPARGRDSRRSRWGRRSVSGRRNPVAGGSVGPGPRR